MLNHEVIISQGEICPPDLFRRGMTEQFILLDFICYLSKPDSRQLLHI